METKHTEGEWTTEDCSNGGLIVCLGDTKSWDSQRVQIANKANAKLIAAAPELLEALIKLINELDGQMLNTSTNYYIDNAKNAIKKATK